MKFLSSIALFIIIQSCSNSNITKTNTLHDNATDNLIVLHDSISEKETIEPYDFDTILKKGYHLSYRVYKDDNEKMQSLVLVKGTKDIKQINETSYPMLHKNLGYIGADFGDFFVFVQSFGSGNPNEFQLIEKKAGKELKQGVLVDVNEDESVLLYITYINENTQQLKIFDLINNKEIIVNDFNDSDCVKQTPEGLRDCVKIETVNKTMITLVSEFSNKKITKIFKRN